MCGFCCRGVSFLSKMHGEKKIRECNQNWTILMLCFNEICWSKKWHPHGGKKSGASPLGNPFGLIWTVFSKKLNLGDLNWNLIGVMLCRMGGFLATFTYPRSPEERSQVWSVSLPSAPPSLGAALPPLWFPSCSFECWAGLASLLDNLKSKSSD